MFMCVFTLPRLVSGTKHHLPKLYMLGMNTSLSLQHANHATTWQVVSNVLESSSYHINNVLRALWWYPSVIYLGLTCSKRIQWKLVAMSMYLLHCVYGLPPDTVRVRPTVFFFFVFVLYRVFMVSGLQRLHFISRELQFQLSLCFCFVFI